MNPFEGVSEFIAVAKAQSFSGAARNLGVSTSHVSRQIAALEQRLGASLLSRTTRKVRLTETGQDYLESCVGLVNGIERANEAVSGRQARLEGVLRVSAAGDFAERFVGPALVDFQRQNPGLGIELTFGSRFVDFAQDGTDFAIRYGVLPDSDLVARKLVTRTLVAAASPDYLARAGTPRHPDDLSRHACLVTNNLVWRLAVDGRTAEVRVSGPWRSNSNTAVLNACIGGLGIAYMPLSSYRETLADGRLVPVLAPYWWDGAGTWIVFSDRFYLPLRSRRAIDFLIDRFKGWSDADAVAALKAAAPPL